jgi:hypothetical protein
MRQIRKDLTGKRFGRLLAVRPGQARGHRTYWACQCDWGGTVEVRSDGLACGDNVSCGCKKIDQLTEHGATGTPEHKTWLSMIERCHWPQHADYWRYGGRGIIVCARWRESFQNFLSDMGPRPTGMSLDRHPNNNGNYEPSNCRWATRKQQQRNMRSNRIIVVAGESLCVAEAAERYGKPRALVANRLRAGWSPAEALGLAT